MLNSEADLAGYKVPFASRHPLDYNCKFNAPWPNMLATLDQNGSFAAIQRVVSTAQVGVQVISLDQAPEGDGEFDAGVPKRFVIDPHRLFSAA